MSASTKPMQTELQQSDAVLLRAFLAQGDELAFDQLVRRYQSLVMRVCRRVLGDEHDAEDAFQATFLLLARHGSRVRKRASLASWLHTVARRTAYRLRQQRSRHREESLQQTMNISDNTLSNVSQQYEQEVLDEELEGLATKYRDPLTLRYLMGYTNREIAGQLGVSEGVVEGRLKRGKWHLRSRLIRRGINLAGVLTAVQLLRSSAQTVASETLVRSTAKTAVSYRASGFSAEVGPVATRQLLTEGMGTMSTSATVVPVTALAVIVSFLATMGGVVAQQAETNSDSVIVLSPFDSNESKQNVFPTIEVSHKPSAVPVMVMDDTFQPDLKQPSSAEAKVRDALLEDILIDFIDAPLQEVIDFLSVQLRIPIEIDARSLDDVGIATDTFITRNLQGVSLKSALNLILSSLDLTYIVRDEVLFVTTLKQAEEYVETHVYEVGQLGVSELELAVTISATIRPGTWRADDAEESDSLSCSIRSLPGLLVVTHNQHTHEEVVDLLAQLHRLQNRRAEAGGTQ